MNNIADAWISLQSCNEGTTEYAAHEWALHELGYLIALDPVHAWEIVKSIYEIDPSNLWIIENLGAGPVETLLRMHGAIILPLASSYSEEHPKFKNVLRHVWRHSLPAEVDEGLRELLN